MSMQAVVPAQPRRRRLRQRHLWLVPGLAVAIFANSIASRHGLGLVPLLTFGIVPHLSVLVGIGQPRRAGQLARRAVPIFNAMHYPLIPLGLAGIAAAGVLPAFWLVGALAWLSHIVIDWALGEGLRAVDGYLHAGSARFIGVGLVSVPVRSSE
jgi:hypothetical protein